MPTSALPSAQQRRELAKSARRDAILSAARKVFAREGFDGTTIADIAREAGVAAGTVYLYYASKIDLFAALNAQLYDVINTALRDADAPPDLIGGTRSRVRAVFKACGQHRDLLRLVFLNPDPRTEVARRMKHADEQRQRPLAELFAGGMQAGVVRKDDPKLLARLVTGVVTIGLYQCFVQSDGSGEETYEELVSDMIVGGLSP
jgi:AcrR family transcriptional regulator